MAINPKDKQGARYRRVSIEMYADDKFCALSPLAPSGQGLWIYLLTGPFSTLIPGICIGGEAGISEALRWPLKLFRRAFEEIAFRKMARADWAARVVYLPNALRHNLPQSPSVVRGWRQAWAEVPSCTLKHAAGVEMRAVLDVLGHAYGQEFAGFALRRASDPQPASQAAPQPAAQPVSEAVEQAGPHQEQEQDQDLPPTPLQGGERVPGRRPHPLDERVVLEPWSVEASEQFLSVYPQKQGRAAALKAWHALNPDRPTVAQILASVRDRMARGWGRELQFVPFPGRFLEEKRWLEPWTPPAVPAHEMARRVDDVQATSAYLASLRGPK